jgi:hypothetical protein
MMVVMAKLNNGEPNKQTLLYCFLVVVKWNYTRVLQIL